MPNPAEGNPPPFLKGASDGAQRVHVTPDPSQHVVAHVFKVSVDPYVGKLGIFRVHQGTVRPGTQLFVGDARKPFKIAHLYKLMGQGYAWRCPRPFPATSAPSRRSTSCTSMPCFTTPTTKTTIHLKSIAFPPPMLGVAIEPERRGDEQRLADALHKLTAEDPCVRVEHHASLNETVLYGMGEFHLRVLLERMTERYGVKIKTHPPSIPYRETITRPAEGHCRHKKQTGGAGQFGEVFLRVEALERGAGFEFVDDVVGGAIPGQFIPAVEKGVRQALGEGAVAGFPLQDIRVTVYRRQASRGGFEGSRVRLGRPQGVSRCHPARRTRSCSSRWCAWQITRARELDRRHHRRSGDEARAHQRQRLASRISAPSLTALVPLAEITEYQSRLKSLTGGEGVYTMELSHYDPVPPRKQQELVQAWRPREAEE